MGTTGGLFSETATPRFTWMSRKCAFGNGKGQGLSSSTRMGLQGGFSGRSQELKPDMKTGCKGKRGPPRGSNPGQVCAEGTCRLRALAWEFHKSLIWFCRFGFEDLLLGLPVLSAPLVPTWHRVKVGWVQELGSRCPEDFDRKPASNQVLLSPRGKPQCSYLTKCAGNCSAVEGVAGHPVGSQARGGAQRSRQLG